jgi:Putative MetA-pathway of phenol degradation
MRHVPLLCATLLAALPPAAARAQDNYEIQVYGSSLVPAGRTMVELHSNFTVDGRAGIVDSLLPTEHAFHETLEITHGFTPWAEVGFYVFTSARGGNGWSWVGDHIRPRIAVPASWHWPVGVSLSTEIGYQRRAFSTDTWTWEIRPIIDQQLGRWYWALNPALEKSIVGESASRGWEFSPDAAVSYDVSEQVTTALEYYGSFGPVSGFDPGPEQQHQLFGALDLNVSPQWEINLGVGRGFTASTDRLIVKTIFGYRLPF